MDVTAIKNAQHQLELLNAELEQKVEQRTEELSRLASRLKMLAWELSSAEERERRRLAKVLHDHLQQLLVGMKLQLGIVANQTEEQKTAQAVRAIENLTDEALAATRNLTVELSPPVLYDTGLTAALASQARRLEEQNHFHVEIESHVPEKRMGEEHRVLLFDCVRELLLNAVKHSGSGRAKVELTEENEKFIKVVVSDQGRGFSVEGAEEAEPSHFGLFHIRQRLEGVGGCLDIQSQPGKGTTATMICPAGAQEAAIRKPAMSPEISESAEDAETPETESGKIRILLADDHGVVREGLRLLLDEPDFAIVGEAVNGNQAIEMALRLKPDVILMDVNMPKVNGVEATRTITRQLPRTRIVALSVHDTADMGDQMSEAGAAAYLNKGSSQEELFATIRQVMEDRP